MLNAFNLLFCILIVLTSFWIVQWDSQQRVFSYLPEMGIYFFLSLFSIVEYFLLNFFLFNWGPFVRQRQQSSPISTILSFLHYTLLFCLQFLAGILLIILGGVAATLGIGGSIVDLPQVAVGIIVLGVYDINLFNLWQCSIQFNSIQLFYSNWKTRLIRSLSLYF
jgi:hypothetical protein